MEETVKSLMEASELYVSNLFVFPARALLKISYQTELLEQFHGQHSEKDELYRSLWLDAFRWMCLYRLKSLAFGDSLTPVLKDILCLFTNNFYDPWCNYTMSRGWNCRQCPLVTLRAVKWEPPSSSIVEHCYLRCRMRNPVTRKALAFQSASLIDKAEFSEWIQRQMTDGTVIQVSNALQEGEILNSEEVSHVR